MMHRCPLPRLATIEDASEWLDTLWPCPGCDRTYVLNKIVNLWYLHTPSNPAPVNGS